MEELNAIQKKKKYIVSFIFYIIYKIRERN